MIEKTLGLYFQVRSPYYQVAQNTYFCILNVTGQVWENQKRISIKTNAISVHLPEPVSNDLTIKSGLVLTSLMEKDGVQNWSV